jgi:hypothetical protein
MSEYSAAISWVVILGVLFVVGLIYMMITPLVDAFLVIGNSAGADAITMGVLESAWKVYTPVVILFGIIVYGWRKSRNRIA